jgi:hypothetical protein
MVSLVTVVMATQQDTILHAERRLEVRTMRDVG